MDLPSGILFSDGLMIAQNSIVIKYSIIYSGLTHFRYKAASRRQFR